MSAHYKRAACVPSQAGATYVRALTCASTFALAAAGCSLHQLHDLLLQDFGGHHKREQAWTGRPSAPANPAGWL